MDQWESMTKADMKSLTATLSKRVEFAKQAVEDLESVQRSLDTARVRAREELASSEETYAKARASLDAA